MKRSFGNERAFEVSNTSDTAGKPGTLVALDIGTGRGSGMNKRYEVIDRKHGEPRDLNRNGMDDEIEPTMVDITAGSKQLADRLRNNSGTNPTLSGGDIDALGGCSRAAVLRSVNDGALGTRLLGVRAVIARGFERIHRSNLIGMGVFPCQFPEGVSAETFGLDGTERFDLEFGAPLRPRQTAELRIERRDGRRDSVPLVLRIDTPIEAAYFSAGGILPYVLEQMLAEASDATKEGAPTSW